MMVTSRLVLGVPGEVCWTVPPLHCPSAAAGASDIAASDAVRLFAARASERIPGFSLADVPVHVIGELCRRLDGLPLAIELAAARVRLLPPQALLSRLDERFSLLTGGARDLPGRQQTLRNTLDWSFGLLSAIE
jgi:predicted ATPase